jgi:hypothetical protein
VFAHPLAAARAVGEDLGLPDLSLGLPPAPPAAEGEVVAAVAETPSGPPPTPAGPVQESDGLEWLLRLAVLWQQAAEAPFRRTQGGGYFKRDQERLAQDPLLTGPPAERLAEVPDPGFLVAEWAVQGGVVGDADGELRAGELPPAWEAGLWPALEALWAGLFRLRTWEAGLGWRGPEPTAGTPFPSAYLFAFLLLARLPDGAWVRPDIAGAWVAARHPYWIGDSLRPSRQRPWLEGFLLGVAYPLRLVRAARDADGGWLVRLTATARWLLGLGEQPPPPAAFPRCLLVQPNLEIVAYRQGLTPALIARLTRLATWQSLGAACTLQLRPETVYRALESGLAFDALRLTLEQHGTRPTPPAVLDALRTWADKRERIVVYPSATLLEFAAPDDLAQALARGLAAVRLSDTLAVVASEDAIDFRQFRLIGTRDYSATPERCVTVDADGVSLTVDQARSDLLLESELPRFAERLDRGTTGGPRQYRLTPASLAAARAEGLTATLLEAWFQQRAGQPLSPAARLLLAGAQAPPPRLQRLLVLQVAAPELADGLQQWPQTRGLIEARLGPTTLAVPEAQAERLRERLRTLGIELAE